MTHVGYMDIFLPKLLGQALTEGPQRKLAGGKDASDRASSNTSSCTTEDQGPPLSARLLKVILLECKYRSTRE